MNKYDELLEIAYSLGLKVVENHHFSNPRRRGSIKRRTIFISYKVKTLKEKCVVLNEEISHFKSNIGNILDQSNVKNRKEELKARRYASESLVPINTLIETAVFCGHGCQVWQVAEELNVTENFLIETLDIYSRKYGPQKIFGQYVVQFDPFCIHDRASYFN